MSDEIIKILDDLGERLGVAIDWTSENVIPMLEVLYEKFVNYSIIIKSAEFGLCVVSTILALLIGHRIIKDYIKCKTSESNTLFWKCRTYTYFGSHTSVDETTICIVATIFSVIMLIVGIVGTIGNFGELIKLITIPELYVFEYLKAYL